MKITIVDASDNLCSLEVDTDMQILDLKALIEIEVNLNLK